MAGPAFLPGFDDLVIPAFLDNGDEAALAQWKREHPDWFVAGTWTPPRRASSRVSALDERDRTATFLPGRGPGEGNRNWGLDQLAALDPATLSLADFKAVAAAARAQRDSPTLLVQAQFGAPPRPARGFGGRLPQSPAEEFRQYRFDNAVRTLRRLEPDNPKGVILTDPDRAPGEEMVELLEREAQLAIGRSRLRIAPGPGEPDPATPFQRESLRRNMLREGFIAEGDGLEAHHITPGGGPMAGERDAGLAQRRLRELGVDLDSVSNGVALSPGFHRRLHTKEYYDYVNTLIEGATSARDLVVRLRRFARRLQQEDLNYQKTRTMPYWSE